MKPADSWSAEEDGNALLMRDLPGLILGRPRVDWARNPYQGEGGVG